MRKEILSFKVVVNQQSDPDETPPSDGVGQVIAEKYEVLNLIASGANGSVYKVRHTEIDKILALKTLKVSNRTSESALLRLQREARALSKLKHPNIIGVHTLANDAKNGSVLIMDFLEGTTLETFLLAQGALPQTEALAIIKDICSGLSAAHAEGVLHRDLKPSNIMLVYSGTGRRAVLIDFGLAKLTADQQKLTSTAAVIGTPAYMSPEQGRGKVADARSDVYSVGCLLFEVLQGHKPFEADTSFGLLMKHFEEAPPRIQRDELTATQNQALSRIVQKAMHKDPEHRYQSAADLERDIDATIRGDAKSISTRALPQIQSPTSSVKTRGTTAAILVSAIVAIIAIAANVSFVKDAFTGGDTRVNFDKSFGDAMAKGNFVWAQTLATKFLKQARAERNAEGEIVGLMALAEVGNLAPAGSSPVPTYYQTARKVAEDNKLSTFAIDMAEADYHYWHHNPEKMNALYIKWLEKPEDAAYLFIIPYRLADSKFTERKLEETEAFLKIAHARLGNRAEEHMYEGLYGCTLVLRKKYKEANDVLRHTLKGKNLGLDPIDASRFYACLAEACKKIDMPNDALMNKLNARAKLLNLDPGHEARGEMMKTEVTNIVDND